jgi:hypothetical protein
LCAAFWSHTLATTRVSSQRQPHRRVFTLPGHLARTPRPQKTANHTGKHPGDREGAYLTLKESYRSWSAVSPAPAFFTYSDLVSTPSDRRSKTGLFPEVRNVVHISKRLVLICVSLNQEMVAWCSAMRYRSFMSSRNSSDPCTPLIYLIQRDISSSRISIACEDYLR